MALVNRTEAPARNYLPIYLEALRIDSVVDFDLYIKIGGDLILYRASDLPFTEKTRSTLLDNNVSRLFVPTDATDKYQNYIESNIDQIMTDKAIPEPTKAGIVYDSTKLLVKDILAKPTLGENVRRGKSLVETSVAYILNGQEAFHNLLRVMSFDYYTYTHSVNVCTFSVAFAQYMGLNDEEFLNRLGTGALLHDVGKTKISDRILSKQTSLTPLEMELVKRHPQWGVELIKETDLIHDDSYFPILQHHERDNGSGYPYAVREDQIHIYAKIVAIADTFDAMTTQRVYQRAMATFPALKTMFKMKEVFDRTLLEKFAYLMGPSQLSKM